MVKHSFFQIFFCLSDGLIILYEIALNSRNLILNQAIIIQIQIFKSYSLTIDVKLTVIRLCYNNRKLK